MSSYNKAVKDTHSVAILSGDSRVSATGFKTRDLTSGLSSSSEAMHRNGAEGGDVP